MTERVFVDRWLMFVFCCTGGGWGCFSSVAYSFGDHQIIGDLCFVLSWSVPEAVVSVKTRVWSSPVGSVAAGEGEQEDNRGVVSYFGVWLFLARVKRASCPPPPAENRDAHTQLDFGYAVLLVVGLCAFCCHRRLFGCVGVVGVDAISYVRVACRTGETFFRFLYLMALRTHASRKNVVRSWERHEWTRAAASEWGGGG